MNLPTPANIQEAAVRAMRDGKTGYCPNGGIAPLREALAVEISRSHGMNCAAETLLFNRAANPSSRSSC